MGNEQSNQHRSAPAPESNTFIAYHGTSFENGRRIAREGFKPSADGCLGAGVYVAKEDKARRFAGNDGRHGAEDGVLIKCRVTVNNPKYLKGGNTSSADHASHDAVRTNYTTSSPNPEWVIRNAAKVEAIDMHRVPTKKSKWCGCKTPGCGKSANGNPAYRNAKAEINWAYCCEACRLSGGKHHGGWCHYA